MFPFNNSTINLLYFMVSNKTLNDKFLLSPTNGTETEVENKEKRGQYICKLSSTGCPKIKFPIFTVIRTDGEDIGTRNCGVP